MDQQQKIKDYERPNDSPTQIVLVNNSNAIALLFIIDQNGSVSEDSPIGGGTSSV